MAVLSSSVVLACCALSSSVLAGTESFLISSQFGFELSFRFQFKFRINGNGLLRGVD